MIDMAMGFRKRKLMSSYEQLDWNPNDVFEILVLNDIALTDSLTSLFYNIKKSP